MSRSLGARVNKSSPPNLEIMRGSLNLFARNDWKGEIKKIDCLTHEQKRPGSTLRFRKVGFEMRISAYLNCFNPTVDIPSFLFTRPKFVTLI